MTEYEIMLILDPEAPEGRHDEIIARTRELVEGGGGTWDGHDPWGRRKLAYEIGKQGEGVYHVLYFTCDAEVRDEISRVLKIADGVMRHGAFRRIVPPARSQARPPAPSGAAEPAEYAAPVGEDVQEGA